MSIELTSDRYAADVAPILEKFARAVARSVYLDAAELVDDTTFDCGDKTCEGYMALRALAAALRAKATP